MCVFLYVLILVLTGTEGNLSLLISHLTKEDEGVYRCYLNEQKYTDMTLTVTGCDCTGIEATQNITFYVGGSVLLPCSCTDLCTTPQSLYWAKLNTTRNTWSVMFLESDQYRNRVHLFTAHSPGNLSLLISCLRVEDGGMYICSHEAVENRYIRLNIQDSPQTLPYIPFALITVIFLHIIMAVVYCTKRTKALDPAPVYYNTADG